MSRNAFDQIEREYNEREDWLANRAEERKKEMSPRHNVGSVKDPHWVVDEEHYEKLQAKLAAVTKRKDECSNGWDEALARSNLLACALRSLLSKCACCGGTGEVGTGIIQMEHPAMMPCFVCAGERGILLKECGK